MKNIFEFQQFLNDLLELLTYCTKEARDIFLYVYRGALLPFAANGPLIRNTHPKLHSEALWRMMPPMGVDAYAHKNIS